MNDKILIEVSWKEIKQWILKVLSINHKVKLPQASKKSSHYYRISSHCADHFYVKREKIASKMVFSTEQLRFSFMTFLINVKTFASHYYYVSSAWSVIWSACTSSTKGKRANCRMFLLCVAFPYDHTFMQPDFNLTQQLK